MFVQTRMEKPLKEAAEHVARKVGVSRGALMRRALLTEIRRHPLPKRMAARLNQLPMDDAEE